MKLLQIITLVAAMQAVPAAPQAATGTVRVRVIAADTRQPIAGAQVSLGTGQSSGIEKLPNNEQDLLAYLTQLAAARNVAAPVTIHISGNPPWTLTVSPAGTGIPSQKTANTDENGEAVFIDVPHGIYTVTARHENYVAATRAESTATHEAAASAATEISATQPAVVQELSLMKPSSIRGRVTDTNGVGVPNVLVIPALAQTNERGQQTLLLGQSSRTDDAGNYLLPVIGPGEYYIRVSRGGPVALLGLYPSAADLASATRLTVRSGIEITGIDIQVKKP